MPMDRRTAEEKRETMLTDRDRRQAAVITLLNELHDAGFSGLWIDSTQIGGDGHYYCQIIIEDGDVDHERMAIILALAEIYDAKVSLKEIWMNQQKFSRIMLWPHAEGDDG